MIIKSAAAIALASGLVVPETPKLYVPATPAIVQLRNLEATKIPPSKKAPVSPLLFASFGGIGIIGGDGVRAYKSGWVFMKTSWNWYTQNATLSGVVNNDTGYPNPYAIVMWAMFHQGVSAAPSATVNINGNMAEDRRATNWCYYGTTTGTSMLYGISLFRGVPAGDFTVNLTNNQTNAANRIALIFTCWLGYGWTTFGGFYHSSGAGAGVANGAISTAFDLGYCALAGFSAWKIGTQFNYSIGQFWFPDGYRSTIDGTLQPGGGRDWRNPVAGQWEWDASWSVSGAHTRNDNVIMQEFCACYY